MTEVQCEKAYQRQFGVSGCFKSKEKKQPGHSGHRYYKSVGLGFKTPREAQFGTYIDNKCPFTGNVSIRGRILTGKLERQRLRVLRCFSSLRPPTAPAVPTVPTQAW